MDDPILKLFKKSMPLEEVIIRRGKLGSHEIKRLKCHKSFEDYFEEITNLIPQAVSAIVSEFNWRPAQEDLRNLNQPKTITVHSASPLHLYQVQYTYLDQNDQGEFVEPFLHRYYVFLPHLTFPMTLIPSRRSYRAKEPLAPKQSLSLSGNSQ